MGSDLKIELAREDDKHRPRHEFVFVVCVLLPELFPQLHVCTYAIYIYNTCIIHTHLSSHTDTHLHIDM